MFEQKFTLNEAYELCLKKLDVHKKNMNDRAFEVKACPDGNYYDYEAGSDLQYTWNWMTSFTTAMGAFAYQTHKDEDSFAWTESFYEQYRAKVFDTPMNVMHDLGFLYLCYSVQIYRMTGDKKHRANALKAADELAKRFNFRGHFIEAWDEMTREKKECRGIVDSMMNVPLLLWAWKETGHTYYKEIAIAVLDTTRENYLREDGSVCHAFFYDDLTGKIKEEVNSCGYANGSHWARGTGWFVYGMAIAYSYTGETRFLEASVKAAKKYVECLTEADSIPVWDFRLPQTLPATACRSFSNEPMWDEEDPANKIYNRDTSAAAIMACAFQLLYKLTKGEYFKENAQKFLKDLCEGYVNPDPQVAGILTASNGCMTYTSFGDYYFMQALASELYDITTCWELI